MGAYPATIGDSVAPQATRSTQSRKKLLRHRIIAIGLPLIIIAGAIGASAAMSALAPEPEEKEDVVKTLPVLTAVAQSDTVQLSVRTQGEVQPRTEINLINEVPGRITYMSPDFIEGGVFQKGDLLVRIDPAEYRLRVTQARANVSQAETVLAREQSEAEIARMDWADLGTGGEATPLTLREPQMAEAAAQLEAAKARLAEAELQLSRTEIRAPFDGRVVERAVDAGEFIAMTGRLGQIYASDIMDVKLPLTQNELRQTGVYLGYAATGDEGLPVTLSANMAGARVEWLGHITRTDAQFDRQSRVLHAYVEVRDPFQRDKVGQPALGPGLFVDADIAGPVLENVVTVPRAALRGDDEVYIVEDDTLTIRSVEVQSSTREEVVISAGIAPGEKVIVSPIRGAATGMKIEVVDRTSSATETEEE